MINEKQLQKDTLSEMLKGKRTVIATGAGFTWISPNTYAFYRIDAENLKLNFASNPYDVEKILDKSIQETAETANIDCIKEIGIGRVYKLVSENHTVLINEKLTKYIKNACTYKVTGETNPVYVYDENGAIQAVICPVYNPAAAAA